ncbi:MAG TPA: ferredoxin [Jatrophihabitans sp.]
MEALRDRCQGTGACVYTAPDVFALDDDNLVTIIGETDVEDGVQDDSDADARIRDAVEECPMAALRLTQN